MTRPISLAISLLIALLALGGPASAEILISEIMYNPQGDDYQTGDEPYNKEWVEIYNSGTEPVDLTGWQLEDTQDGHASQPFSTGTVLEPGKALVITGDAATFDRQYGTGIPRIQVDDFPSLTNDPSPTNDTIALRDNAGQIRDSVNYDDEHDWCSVRGVQGASLFLKPEGLTAAANDLGANWAPSSSGVYGAAYYCLNKAGENNASPGIVVTEPQAPFQPSLDAAWSMVVLPDTQNYVKSPVYKNLMVQMCEWIRDNRDPWKIQLVLHEGDIVNNNDYERRNSSDESGSQQWQNARDALALLDGHVPYVLATGNHDFGTTNAQNRNTQINNYFHASDNPLVDPAQGGILRDTMQPGHLENACYELTAPDGRKLLIFSLEWGPRQQVVDWANEVAARPEYAGHTAVLLTHAYMFHDETRYDWSRNQDSDRTNDQGNNPHSYPTKGDTNDGEDLWRKLVSRYPSFQLVFSGHVGADGLGYLQSTGQHGNTVHQMLFNTQFEAHGGNGWLRVVEFLDDGTTVRIRTYSPFLKLQRTDDANRLEFKISPLPQKSVHFDGRGEMDRHISGASP